MDFITVSGTVTASSDGLGIPGVNVLIKGTLTGTVTDIDGSYTLNVPDENAVLVFSSIGYITQEIPVNGRSTIDLVLAEDVQNLDEVVVIGYGLVKKGDLTGAMTAVESKAINVQSNSTVTRALEGLVPGLQISAIDGQPWYRHRYPR